MPQAIVPEAGPPVVKPAAPVRAQEIAEDDWEPIPPPSKPSAPAYTVSPPHTLTILFYSRSGDL
jgi:hypothetical protein